MSYFRHPCRRKKNWCIPGWARAWGEAKRKETQNNSRGCLPCAAAGCSPRVWDEEEPRRGLSSAACARVGGWAGGGARVFTGCCGRQCCPALCQPRWVTGTRVRAVLPAAGVPLSALAAGRTQPSPCSLSPLCSLPFHPGCGEAGWGGAMLRPPRPPTHCCVGASTQLPGKLVLAALGPGKAAGELHPLRQRRGWDGGRIQPPLA